MATDRLRCPDGRGIGRAWRWPGLVLACLLLALVPMAIGACRRAVPGPYTPSVTGVMERFEPAADGAWLFQLESGAAFEARPGQSGHFRQVYPPDSRLSIAFDGRGELLLAGTDEAGDWFAHLRLTGRADLPPDCYELPSWGTDEGDTVLADVGLRLPKAADFNPELLPLTPGGYVPRASPGMRYEATLQVFCLNTAGEVTIRDWGLWQATR